MDPTRTANPDLNALARRLIRRGVTDPEGHGREQIIERALHAHSTAQVYIDDCEQPPAWRDLFAAIVQQVYPTLLDHALAWADFQVELHEAAPGDQWQVLSQSAQGVWQANPVGSHDLAIGGYRIETAMRGIVIHLERESYDLASLDMSAVFQAIDTHVSALEGAAFPSASTLACMGLRGVALDQYIY